MARPQPLYRQFAGSFDYPHQRWSIVRSFSRFATPSSARFWRDTTARGASRSPAWQQQYIAAVGGLSCFKFHPDGRVTSERLAISDDTPCHLEHNLLMFFTGYTHSAAEVLNDQKRRSVERDAAMIDNLHFTRQPGLAARDLLEQGNTRCYAELLNEHWEHKRARSKGMTNVVTVSC